MNEIPLSLMVIFIAVVFAFGALWQDSEREELAAPGFRASDERGQKSCGKLLRQFVVSQPVLELGAVVSLAGRGDQLSRDGRENLTDRCLAEGLEVHE